MLKKPEPGQPILVDIGTVPYEIKFPLRTLKLLDTEQKINVLRGEGMNGVFTDPERLAVLLYYGLRNKHPEVTLDWVEDNIDASMLLELAPLLAYATTGRWPKINGVTTEDESPNEDGENRIHGSPYGASEDTTLVSTNANFGG